MQRRPSHGEKASGSSPVDIAVTSSGVVVGDCENHQLYLVDTDLDVTEWIQVPSFGDFFSVIETVGGPWVLAAVDDVEGNSV